MFFHLTNFLYATLKFLDIPAVSYINIYVGVVVCLFIFANSDVILLSIPGVDFKMKTLEIDGIKVRIQIW